MTAFMAGEKYLSILSTHLLTWPQLCFGRYQPTLTYSHPRHTNPDPVSYWGLFCCLARATQCMLALVKLVWRWRASWMCSQLSHVGKGEVFRDCWLGHLTKKYGCWSWFFSVKSHALSNTRFYLAWTSHFGWSGLVMCYWGLSCGDRSSRDAASDSVPVTKDGRLL